MAETKVLDENIKDFLESKDTVKVVISNGKDGKYHGSRVDYILVADEDTIRFPEYLEGSATNKNLIYSLWFDKYIEIIVTDISGKEYTLTGVPVKSYIEGELFETEYKKTQEKYNGELDLSTIWEIKLHKIERTDITIKSKQEQEEYPIVNHLDRIAKG